MRALLGEPGVWKDSVLEGLTGLGNRSGVTVEELLRLLQDSEIESWRSDVLRLLAEFGPAAEPAVGVLIPLLRDPDAWVRCAAAFALGRIGPAAAPAIESLVPMLDDDSHVEKEAAVAFRQIGPVAAVPVVEWCWRHNYQHSIGQHVTELLQAIGSGAVSYLLEKLHCPGRMTRFHAAWMLGSIGPPIASAIPELIQLILDPVSVNLSRLTPDAGGWRKLSLWWEAIKRAERTRTNVSEALGRIGPDILWHIDPLLKHSDSSIRWWAVRALGYVEPREIAVPLLVTMVVDHDAAVRRLAVYGLGRVGAPAATVIATLTPLLYDPSGSVRACTADAIKTIAPGTIVDIPPLLPLLRDRSCRMWNLLHQEAQSQGVVILSHGLLRLPSTPLSRPSEESL